MDATEFFNSLRRSRTFGGRVAQSQVDGSEAIIKAATYHGISSQHLANMLAQVFHETGGYMLPIKETVYASHKDKNPSDQTVINRLETAWAKGQLTWVKTPYWRDGWFGRGQIQITHKQNYEVLGKAIGVDLVSDPSKALVLENSAAIVVVGMSRGLFTGKKLSDYVFPDAIWAKPEANPRRIVNGKDGTDAIIAGYHTDFYVALETAGYRGLVAQQEPPARTQATILAEIQALLDELKTLKT